MLGADDAGFAAGVSVENRMETLWFPPGRYREKERESLEGVGRAGKGWWWWWWGGRGCMHRVKKGYDVAEGWYGRGRRGRVRKIGFGGGGGGGRRRRRG
jgi:hypothetical protein